MTSEQKEAVELAVRWCWDPDEDPLVQFERIAEWFYEETGYLRPGKSEPLEMGDRDKEREEAWQKWRREKSRLVLDGLRDALAMEPTP